MKSSAAEKFGAWLLYVGIASAAMYLVWNLDWSTILWILGGLLVALLGIGFMVGKAK